MTHPPLAGKFARAAMLSLTLVLVLAATLLPNEGDGLVDRVDPWCLVCGPHGGADVARNVLLFLPFGLALGLAGLRVRVAVLVALATTLSIEGAQFTVVDGRAATASDVVANTAGAFLGALLAASWRRLLHPGRAGARRLAALGAAVFLLVSAAGAWLVSPVVVPPNARTMWLPPTQTLVRPYEGHVERATLNGGVVVRGGAVVDRVPFRSLREPLVATAEVNAMIPPGMLRPFVSAFTPGGDDLLVVGQRQRHLVLRVRHNGSRLRLHGPQVELREAFPADADVPRGFDPRRGPRVRVRAELRDGMVRMEAEGGGARRVWQVPMSPHLAWVFIAGPVRIDWRTVAGSAAWLAALVAPLAYWACLGWRTRRALPALAVGVALVLLAVPAMAEFPPPPIWEWIGAAAGLVTGAGLAAVRRPTATSRRPVGGSASGAR